MSNFSIPFNRSTMVARELEYLADAIGRGQLSGDGHYTQLCSDRLETLTGAPKALLTHSCTGALEMVAILCDLGPGDEVIMPSFTFVSTANAVVLRGATPVFVDIDPDTLNIAPSLVAQAITPQTKAIIAVHYAGFPADMDQLAELARMHDVFLIEDAAQALGSSYKGRPVGSLGDMATFSFHETKNVISGEGGALIINRPDLVERAEIIREKGTNRSCFLRGQVDKYSWVDIGSSFLPGELVAAFLFAQLEQEEEIRKRRLALYRCYEEAFSAAAAQGLCQVPLTPRDGVGNGHMFYLLLDDRGARDAFIDAMHSMSIDVAFHYVPLHSSPAGRRFGRAQGSMVITDDIAARLVRLPMFGTLEAQVDKVISAARHALKQQATTAAFPLV